MIKKSTVKIQAIQTKTVKTQAVQKRVAQKVLK